MCLSLVLAASQECKHSCGLGKELNKAV